MTVERDIAGFVCSVCDFPMFPYTSLTPEMERISSHDGDHPRRIRMRMHDRIYLQIHFHRNTLRIFCHSRLDFWAGSIDEITDRSPSFHEQRHQPTDSSTCHRRPHRSVCGCNAIIQRQRGRTYPGSLRSASGDHLRYIVIHSFCFRELSDGKKSALRPDNPHMRTLYGSHGSWSIHHTSIPVHTHRRNRQSDRKIQKHCNSIDEFAFHPAPFFSIFIPRCRLPAFLCGNGRHRIHISTD